MDKKCRYCDKVISGQSEEQIDRLLLIHIVSKHRENVKFKEVNNDKQK